MEYNAVKESVFHGSVNKKFKNVPYFHHENDIDSILQYNFLNQTGKLVLISFIFICLN